MRATMTEFEAKVVNECLRMIGRPYIWAGKGDIQWTLNGPRKFNDGLIAFDCCGLIEWALWRAGRKDHRLTDNAQTEFDMWAKATPAYHIDNETPLHPMCAFYGRESDAKSPRRVDHVALIVVMHGRLYSIEAAGGGSHTLVPTPGAQVMMRPMPIRKDLLGYRTLPSP